MPTSRETPTVALQQVTSTFARANAGKTLEKPVGLNYVTRYLEADEATDLEALCPEGKVYVWGSKFERVHQYGKMVPGYSRGQRTDRPPPGRSLAGVGHHPAPGS